MLPDKVYGREDTVLHQESPGENDFVCRGTLEEWKQNVGVYAANNSRVILGLGVAFAAPLLGIIDAESGGIHLRGSSSIGKTTAMRVAASVWGAGDMPGYIKQWRSTTNGLEGVARDHCDTLLCLDEIGQAPALEVGQVAYMLANGTGKLRADRNGGARKPFDWRILFLSNGEASLASIMTEAKAGATKAGHEVRIIDLTADAGKSFGLFESTHCFKSGDELSTHLRGATKRYFGSPIRAFLEQIVASDRPNLVAKIKSYMKLFSDKLKIEASDGQVKRVASRFALIAAAGELAIALGIIPINKDQSIWASEICFQSWLQSRGGDGAHEIRALTRKIHLFFEQHGESRFSDFTDSEGLINPQVRISNRCGFKRRTEDGIEYFVLPEVFKSELCHGFDSTWASKTLREQGYLVAGEGGRASKKMRLPGFKQSRRCYHFTDKIHSDAEA